MGNDISSTTTAAAAARTPIPLDDSACWQLYNAVNQRSEPISIFISKQTFSVECRRSIQFLKTVRHPNIIKFLTGFKTSVEHDSFIADCIHPLANKLKNNDIHSTAKLCLGLYQLAQALEFLHEKASISHNNVCLISLYVSLNGIWKLGNFECACRYDNLNKKYLSSLKIIRAEECMTPEEDEKNSADLDKQQFYAIDVYAFGTLIRNLMTIINVDDLLKNLLNDLQVTLMEEDPESRPTWPMLLKTELFQTDYIKAIELLDRLPTIEDSDLPNVVQSLSTYLDDLDAEYFNELLIRRLFVPFMFLCSSTRLKLIPRILVPKDENNNSWICADTYRIHVIPILIDLFSYHVTCIRETLLQYFNSYWQLIDKTTLVNIILPQLVYGLKDSNNTICMLTLIALSSMVPILGADIVVGGQRKQIFTDKMKKENITFPKISKNVSETNSPLPTPQRTRKASPAPTNKTKISRLKPSSPIKTTSEFSSPQYTNGHHSPPPNKSFEEEEQQQLTVIQNGLSDHHVEDEIDNDDGQWSDWEHPVDPIEPSIDYSQLLPSSPLPSDEAVQQKISSLPSKSLQLNNKSSKKWDSNAPLGSEYEIPPIVLSKKTTTKVETSLGEESEDFFKDMTPKVETVELMRQLETMFNIDTNNSKEQEKPTKSTSSISNKFGIMPQDVIENNQEAESGNNWDE